MTPHNLKLPPEIFRERTHARQPDARQLLHPVGCGDSDAAIDAIDALRPDQAVMLEEHVAAQRGAGGVRGDDS